MLVKYRKPNRFARIIAERDGIVLFHAIDTTMRGIDGFEKGVFNPNMVRPSEAFWAEYSA